MKRPGMIFDSVGVSGFGELLGFEGVTVATFDKALTAFGVVGSVLCDTAPAVISACIVCSGVRDASLDAYSMVEGVELPVDSLVGCAFEVEVL